MNWGKAIFILLVLILVPIPAFIFLVGLVGKAAIPIGLGIVACIIYSIYVNIKLRKEAVIKKGYDKKSVEYLKSKRADLQYQLNILGLPVGKSDSDNWKRDSLKDQIRDVDYAIKLVKKRDNR